MRTVLLQHVTEHCEELKEILEKYDMEVIIGTSCRKTMTRAEVDGELDLVICDVGIPDCGAMHLLQCIRSAPQFRWLPVIVTGDEFQKEIMGECIAQGACDSAVLPAPESAFMAKVTRALALGKRTILLVTCEPSIAESLGSSLQMDRFRILIAGSAGEALEMLRTERVQVIVTDIVLPGMFGLNLPTTPQEYSETIPVILITGQDASSQLYESLTHGIGSYLAISGDDLPTVCALNRAANRGAESMRNFAHHVVTHMWSPYRDKRSGEIQPQVSSDLRCRR